MKFFDRWWAARRSRSNPQVPPRLNPTAHPFVARHPAPPSARSNDEDFVTSAVVANATSNAALGFLAGGSLLGAVAGAAVASDSDRAEDRAEPSSDSDRDSGSSSPDCSSDT